MKICTLTALTLLSGFHAFTDILVPFDTPGDWSSTNPASITHSAVLDPVGGTETVGSFALTENNTTFGIQTYDLGIGIADGASDSITFSFYITGDPADNDVNHWFGFSDVSSPGGFSDMEAYFGIREDAGSTGSDTYDLIARDGGSSPIYDTDLAADTWHTVTMDIDNSADTYSITVNNTVLGSNLGFRNGAAANALNRFVVFGRGESSTVNYTDTPVLVDIGVIPEPSSLALAAIAFASLCLFRRRK